MAPSQLKQLKASLRENGVLGPQQSKKQKKRNAQDGRNGDKARQRNAALLKIREKFNPFEAQALPRPAKFAVTSAKSLNGGPSRSLQARPGLTKGLGEERVKVMFYFL